MGTTPALTNAVRLHHLVPTSTDAAPPAGRSAVHLVDIPRSDDARVRRLAQLREELATVQRRLQVDVCRRRIVGGGRALSIVGGFAGLGSIAYAKERVDRGEIEWIALPLVITVAACLSSMASLCMRPMRDQEYLSLEADERRLMRELRTTEVEVDAVAAPPDV